METGWNHLLHFMTKNDPIIIIYAKTIDTISGEIEHKVSKI